MKAQSQYDVPSTWQVLNLSQPGCGYLNDERPVKHEFLHALGFLHEQSRPDRGQFLDVDTSQLSSGWASQFDLMDSSEWLDTSHPYEALSVMHYGSYLGGTLGRVSRYILIGYFEKRNQRAPRRW